MADAAVRVDIIVGQNTVVPSVERTNAALRGVTRSAGTLNTGFDNLSTRGMRKVEAGFQNIAARAVGLQGPWSKVVEGMLLLGAGSTVVLGVAAGTALVAKAIELVGKKSREAETAFKSATLALEEFLNPKNPLQSSIDVIAEKISILQMRMLSTFDPKLLAQYNAEMVRLQKLLTDVQAKQAGADKPAKAAKPGESAGAFGQRMTNGIAMQPSVVAPPETAIAIRDNIIAPLDEATAVWQEYNAEMADGIAKQESVFEMVNLLGPAFEGMAEGIGAAIAGYGNIAKVMIQAASQALQAIANMHAKQELAAAAESFALGTWPPNPAAIAAGVKHLQAAALWKIAAGAAGVAGSVGAGMVGGGSASGGVNSGRYERDQQEMGARGTVTIQMGRDGFIRPSDPVFQEFLAQVIKEAKGRNVVFA